MRQVNKDVLDDFHRRGLVAQLTADDELREHLASASRTVYCGFDPTADSLHIGSLVPLLALRRFQDAGHRPILLMGGATGLIGDPSFKAQERALNTRDVVAGWVDKIQAQVRRFVRFDDSATSALVVNNLDWIGEMSVMTFLRDVGKHFSVNTMIQREAVRQRIEREGSGISFTEFSYLILQSLDFAELNARHGCTVQLGGSDQWGNITGGIDYTRRVRRAQVYGMTMPLVTKADGTKFGKTESGTIWLDGARTSPYAFYQFWLGTSDADVYKFLRYFTFLAPETIAGIEAEDAVAAGRPQAQQVLASHVTELVHGEEGLAAAQRISEALFSGDIRTLDEADLRQLRQDGLPSSTLDAGELARPLTQILSDGGLAASGKQVKDALARDAVHINGQPVGADSNLDAGACFAVERALFGRYFLARLGKKKWHLFERV
ncbi:MAG TPA: tyrosine--tRNA ligase [Spongiibacteraceae bacterium]|jgi:tyrosyl-tRNA synthetase|nr:tyrosine--tRNA ligase [Spongiibacteraceae bacterium]HUH36902.1 tyrosine--tRNA ligase [Spongiibacteraceae bacterium]